MKYIQLLQQVTLVVLVGILAACSSSSSSPGTTTVSGSVFAGPAAGSKVKVKTLLGNYSTSVTTATDGTFSVTLPDAIASSDLIFEASGGTYDDEADQTATGKGVNFGMFTAHVAAGTLPSSGHVTIDPSSTIIQKLVASGMARATATTTVGTAFGFIPDTSIKPTLANFSSMPSTISDKQRLSGLQIAAFSQLTKNLGLAPAQQFALVQALANDLADGSLNGKNAVTDVVIPGTAIALPTTIANAFAVAYEAYLGDKLTKPAWTPSYKVEYAPVGMTVQGKSTFTIKLTNRANGTPAAGKTVTFRPYMYMATKSHTTPMGTVTDNGDGTYTCTVYYVMGSSMMNGASMGTWELKVMIGNEAVYFYPKVGMPMSSNTTLAKLLGVNDAIMGMAGLEKRTYFLFNDSLTAEMGGTYAFKLFLATKENGTSLTFPAVAIGSSLNNELVTPWTVATVTVIASTDSSFPASATTVTVTTVDTTGRITIPGISGLTNGVAGTIYVKLFVNGEQKTKDGTSSLAGANGYQAFNVTPGM